MITHNEDLHLYEKVSGHNHAIEVTSLTQVHYTTWKKSRLSSINPSSAADLRIEPACAL